MQHLLWPDVYAEAVFGLTYMWTPYSNHAAGKDGIQEINIAETNVCPVVGATLLRLS